MSGLHCDLRELLRSLVSPLSNHDSEHIAEEQGANFVQLKRLS